MVLATSVTASTGVGTVFPDTAMTGTYVSPLLARLLVVSHLKKKEVFISVNQHSEPRPALRKPPTKRQQK